MWSRLIFHMALFPLFSQDGYILLTKPHLLATEKEHGKAFDS